MPTIEKDVGHSLLGRIQHIGAQSLTPAVLFALALCIYVYAIDWGLPNGNDTWAADAIKPGAPLALVHRALVGEYFNSGWFWFKYPLGHPFVLAAVYSPVVAWLLVTGGLENPSSAYPYGFADPESVLTTFAILGRLVSAAMAAGCVAIAFAIVKRPFGRRAGLGAALVTAFCYPVVFYAHTTNVEVPSLFWMMLALLASTRLVAGPRGWRSWALLGFGAAMSVSTKELGAGFLVGIPCAVTAVFVARRRPATELIRGGVIAAAAFLVTMVLANNILINPSGFVNRIRFLTGTLPVDRLVEYAPYSFPIDMSAGRSLGAELAQLSRGGRLLLASLGGTSLVLAAVGVVVAFRRDPWYALLLAFPALSFYAFGVRAMLSLSLRYLLPIVMVANLMAGLGLAWIWEGSGMIWVRRMVASVAVAYIVVYGWDVNRMLAHDGRYAAEEWLERNLEEGDTVEVYQRPTYLPRVPNTAVIQHIPLAQRGIENFRRRAPAYVIVSSAASAGITVEYRRQRRLEEFGSDEWLPNQISATGQTLNYKHRGATEFLDALVEGTLDYEEVGRYRATPCIDRHLIQSLNPEITIYRRSGG
ncbi:MAG: ArnT family glycosyltransferase [Candidatus Binatia bacterium]